MKSAKQKGIRWENTVKAYFESMSYYCIRSAASLGDYDLIAISSVGIKHRVFGIQCKVSHGMLSQEERVRMLQLAFRHGMTPILAYPRHGPRSKEKDNVVLEEVTS